LRPTGARKPDSGQCQRTCPARLDKSATSNRAVMLRHQSLPLLIQSIE
jgi:hypothetical protein